MSGGNLVALVNSRNPIDSLSVAQARKIFLGQVTHWKSGTNVKLGVPGLKTKEMTEVLKVVYKFPLQKYHAHWLEMVFNGEGQPPAVLDEPRRCIQFAKENLGGICFVADSVAAESVKVVKVAELSGS